MKRAIILAALLVTAVAVPAAAQDEDVQRICTLIVPPSALGPITMAVPYVGQEKMAL
jgi:hypothetical protein